MYNIILLHNTQKHKKTSPMMQGMFYLCWKYDFCLAFAHSDEYQLLFKFYRFLYKCPYNLQHSVYKYVHFKKLESWKINIEIFFKFC